MSVPYKPPKVIKTYIMSPGEEQIRNDLKAKIAERIRRELVCCDISLWNAKEKIPSDHAICHWGEAAARIAESIDDYDD